MKSGIYKLSWDSGYFYIGQSINIPKRWKQHIRGFKYDGSMKKHHIKLYNVWKKHGEPKMEVIAYLPIEFLNQAEQNYINEGIGNKFCCNTNIIAESSKGVKRGRPWNFGRKCTPEEVAQMSAVRIGMMPGQKHHNSKITDAQAIEIRAKYIPFKYPATRLAKDYGLSKCTILKIIKSQAWSHLPSIDLEKNKELVKNGRNISAFGYNMNLRQWGERLNLNPDLLSLRYKKNGDLEKCVNINDHRICNEMKFRTFKVREVWK